MSIFEFVLRMALYFAAVFGVGVIALLFVITGGVGGQDVTMVKEGFGRAYVSGLKGVEQGARRLRGDFCEADGQRPANCG